MVAFPFQLNRFPDKREILSHFQGKDVNDLPTPSVLIDRGLFQKNSDKMLENASNLSADFRAHIKTHKTLEGTELQLGSSKNRTTKIVVSTLSEAWGILPLVERGKIDDVLFSLPVVQSRLPEIAELSRKIPNLRLMLDNYEQLDVLNKFNQENENTKQWSIFIKVNMGTDRAGLAIDTELLNSTVEKLLTDKTTKNNISLYGFYCHAGHSYASDSESKAKSFLLAELLHANKAANIAKKFDKNISLQLSVGATPTAHASETLHLEEIKSEIGEIHGNIELHAGNYPCCDLQQVATNCVTYEDVSLKLLAEVVSTYPGRGSTGPGEQLINAGVLALSRETGPLGGHGKVDHQKYGNWIVARLSQEHGILTIPDGKESDFIPLGTKVKIFPQHACITAASHPFFFVTDNDKVVDVWVSFRGW